MSTVLVVEDEARIASFVSKGLRAAGLSVEVTGSGRQAVARARRGSPSSCWTWACPTWTASRCWSGSAARG